MTQGKPTKDGEPATDVAGSSVLDDVLMKDGDEADEGDYGLELDASQAQEVRKIFFATLPQYLEPIEEMLEQLFSADQVANDLCGALVTTVASIASAAARLDIENARERLERMQDEISQLLDHVGPPPRAARDAVFAELAALRELSADPAAPAPAAGRARTIFAAFKEVSGFDRSVLEKLTAAGLVTVDQVQMAEPREIAAVTGLDMSVVARLIAALSGTPTGAASAAPPGATARDESLESELKSKLRAQVDAEAALEEVRAKVARLRSGKAAREHELSAVVARRDALRAELDAARARVTSRLGALAKKRARRADAEREKAAAEDALQRTRTRIAEISHEKRSISEAYERCTRQLAGLAARVAHLLSAAARESGRATPLSEPPDGLES